MALPTRRPHIAPLLAAALLAACASRGATTAPPPAPSAPATRDAAITLLTPAEIAALPRIPASGDIPASAPSPDVTFMRQMLLHHAQALAMTAMVPSRSARADVRGIAERIEVSQRDEMALMRHWLEARGQSAPAAGAAMAGMQHAGMDHATMDHAAMDHAAMDHAAMPGMLTPAQLDSLGRTTGADFDRGFLRSMIRHHEGALTMVAQLFATTGAAQEPELFRLASDIDADQRAEIARLHALDAAPPRR